MPFRSAATTMSGPRRAVVVLGEHILLKCGTTKQWTNRGAGALNWTRRTDDALGTKWLGDLHLDTEVSPQATRSS